MSSGRDYMMEQWNNQIESAEQNIRESQKQQLKQKMLQRLTGYRQTLINDLQRLDTEIVKIEMELEEHDKQKSL